MGDIRQWLDQIGLPQYAELFDREQIDLAAARDLSDADLKELGLPLGPRTKLRTAIQRLQDTPVAATAPASIESNSINTGDGERRQLTVLFCDMVGFTELANRVDPEVLQKIIRAYEDACAVCITRYEGYVFQRLGDGIVAFFGYPLAHEGEAERAIHAGLAIIDALSKLDVPDAGHLAVRIGIAAGLVVVSSVEKGAVGETMNLASRLQGIAQPGSIVVSERARFSDCLFLQRPRGMPRVQRTAHGRDGRASGRSGLPAAGGAAVGVVGARSACATSCSASPRRSARCCSLADQE